MPQPTWIGCLRISEDPKDLRAGVDRQREDIIAAVSARGGDPEAILWSVENDTSAYKKRRIHLMDPEGNPYVGYRVIRPVWHEVLRCLRRREVSRVMVWDLDRLARDPRDLEDAIEAVQYYGARVEGSVPGSIDLTTDGGIAMARVIVAMNAKSSADTSRRVRRVHEANAKAGKPVGGYRPFGWCDDKLALHPIEAPIARKMAQDVLDGIALRAIARDLNTAGVTTTAGKEWKHQTIRQYLRNPRLCGWRTLRREVLLDASGKPVEGLWEPLMDVETWERLQAVLAPSTGRIRVPRRGARHYFLTGLLRCGKCGGPMYGNRATAKLGTYACQQGHVGATVKHVDDLVGSLIVRRLASERLERLDQHEWPGETNMRELKETLNELMDSFTQRRLSGSLVLPRIEQMELELAQMQKDRHQWLEETTGPVLAVVDEAGWADMEMEQRQVYANRLLSLADLRLAHAARAAHRVMVMESDSAGPTTPRSVKVSVLAVASTRPKPALTPLDVTAHRPPLAAARGLCPPLPTITRTDPALALNEPSRSTTTGAATVPVTW